MSQIIYPITHLPPVIDIGKQTEKGVTRIGFDVHEWLDDWPGMAFSVQPTRPGETESYFAASEMVGSVVFWLVGAVDTEKPGSGTVEVLGVTEDERKLSFMCRTSIANTNTATVAEIPEPNKPWIDQVIIAGETAKKEAKSAAASAEIAGQNSANAHAQAESAEKHAQAAKQSETAAAISASEAAKSVKDMFIVKAANSINGVNQPADKTQAEIRAALDAGKVCLLMNTNSNRVYTYYGFLDGARVFKVTERSSYDSQLYSYVAEVLKDGTVRFYSNPVAAPNPKYLRFTGAVKASYYGGEEVTVEIPSGSLPETADPLKQLVTDESGKAVWEDRLAYKTTAEIVNLAPTELTAGDDDGDGTNESFSLLSPWAVDIEAGKTYDVTYNGTKYACPALAFDQEGLTGCLLGNGNLAGVDGGNPDAPFAMVCLPNSMQAIDWNIFGMLKPQDGATAVTLSVSSVGTTYKTIDPEYLPNTGGSVVTAHAKIADLTVNNIVLEGCDMSLADLNAAYLSGKTVQIMCSDETRVLRGIVNVSANVNGRTVLQMDVPRDVMNGGFFVVGIMETDGVVTFEKIGRVLATE